MPSVRAPPVVLASAAWLCAIAGCGLVAGLGDDYAAPEVVADAATDAPSSVDAPVEGSARTDAGLDVGGPDGPTSVDAKIDASDAQPRTWCSQQTAYVLCDDFDQGALSSAWDLSHSKNVTAANITTSPPASPSPPGALEIGPSGDGWLGEPIASLPSGRITLDAEIDLVASSGSAVDLVQIDVQFANGTAASGAVSASNGALQARACAGTCNQGNVNVPVPASGYVHLGATVAAAGGVLVLTFTVNGVSSSVPSPAISGAGAPQSALVWIELYKSTGSEIVRYDDVLLATP